MPYQSGVIAAKNHVVAREGRGSMPAHFRPQNQALMYRSSSVNPSAADDRDQLSGMGIVLSGNGLGDNGLTSAAQRRRLAHNINHLHTAQRGRLGQLAATGSPNANPLNSQVDMSFQEALRSTSGGGPLSSPSTIVDRIRRDLTDSWEISMGWSGATRVYVAQLVRTTPTGQHMVLLTSDDLATDQDARNYIAAHEFARQSVQGKPPRMLFNAQLNTANASSQAVQRSQMVPMVASEQANFPGEYQPGGNVTNLTNREVTALEMDGLGALPSTPTLIGLAFVVGGAIWFLKKRKRA